jgi:hypothetical protein
VEKTKAPAALISVTKPLPFPPETPVVQVATGLMGVKPVSHKPPATKIFCEASTATAFALKRTELLLRLPPK